MDRFQVPDGLTGRFAVVKLWPTAKVAEDEVIARLKNTARTLGLECVEVMADGRAVDPPHLPVTREDVDFAVHLHFETPKAYDLFSFVALWNPHRIIHEYHPDGGAKLARHMASHDDFLSCGSASADDHVRRTLSPDPTRDGPHFRLYPSLSHPVLEPTTGDGKLAYAGINWERLGKGRGRHQDLLDLLDATGELRIYGPHSLLGVKVWDGYESYAGPLPFDGESVVHAIHRAGVSLVLASAAHKEAGAMSCRLFESLAAGAVVICDEHPFAKEHFGDTLLYVDSTVSVQDTFEQIWKHLRWVRERPEEAVRLARRAQDIFKAKFALDLSLQTIYEGFEERKRELDRRLGPAEEQPATMFLLLPWYDREVLKRHVESVKTQEYAAVDFVLLVDEYELNRCGKEIGDILKTSRKKIECRPVSLADRHPNGKVRRRVPLGRVMFDAVGGLEAGTLCCFVGPNERLTADHLRSLAGCLDRAPDAACAYSDVVIRAAQPRHDGSPQVALLDTVDLLGAAPDRPLGLGRFVFRKSADFAARQGPAMPYLHHKPLATLVGRGPAVPSRRVTVLAEQVGAPDAAEIRMEDEVIGPCVPDSDVVRRLATPPCATPPAAPPPQVVMVPVPPRPPGILRRAFRATPMPTAVRTVCWKVFRRIRQLV